MSHLRTLILCLAALAVGAQTRTPTRPTVHILNSTEAQTRRPPPLNVIANTAVVILDDKCPLLKPGEFWSVVIDEKDSGRQAQKEGDHWIVTRTKFNVGRSYARAYSGNTATDCQRSFEGQDGDDDRGTFELHGLPERAYVVRINAKGATGSYVREWKYDTACRQGSLDPHEGWTVSGVVFGHETIRLQFGRKEPDFLAPGLWIDDLLVLPDPKSGDSPGSEFDRDHVILALRQQRLARKSLSAVPNASSQAIDNDLKTLTEAGLTNLTLKVE